MPNLPPKPGIGCATEPAALFAGHGNGLGAHFLGAFERGDNVSPAPPPDIVRGGAAAVAAPQDFVAVEHHLGHTPAIYSKR